MGRENVWSNEDGLAVGFGTRTETTSGAFRVRENGTTEVLHAEFDAEDLDTSLSATSDFIVYGPVIPNGALILSATLTVYEAFAGGTDIDIGLYEQDGTAVDVDGIDAAVATANIDAIGDVVSCDGADVGTAVNTSGGVKVGVIRTGTFTAGKAVLEVEYKPV